MEKEKCWDCEHGKHLNGKCQRHDNQDCLDGIITITGIIKDIKSGRLCRCNDESYSQGFWQYSQENYTPDNMEQAYGDLWELVDLLKINKCKDCK